MVHWLQLGASSAGGTSSIPGGGTKTPTGRSGVAKKSLSNLFEHCVNQDPSSYK